MKKAIILAAFLSMPFIARGKVSTVVCLADGNTPLELADPNVPFVYRDIMVGTRLTIVVKSDAGGNWGSDLAIEGEYIPYGVLSARGYSDTTCDWAGSRFEAAGYGARVWEWTDPGIQGFNLDGHTSAVPGDWFVIDYAAADIGFCRVSFYDRSVSWDEPAYHLVFTHVRTRDFNQDTKVDLSDLAVFASHWLRMSCCEPDLCAGADLDADGDVDAYDLAQFGEYWCETTEYNPGAASMGNGIEASLTNITGPVSLQRAVDP